MGIKPNTHEKITKYIGVSQLACDTFKEITGKKAYTIYNPIQIDKPRRVLNLISATRLTKEKGKDRIVKFAQILDENNIPYIWTIFTDDIKAIDNPNVVYVKPKLDITNYIANADYLVQLSDNEGYCYSVVEALIVGTPVIVTDMPVMKEIGVNNTNGFIVNFDLGNVDTEKIYNSKFEFEYKPKNDNWDEILEKGESSYMKEMKKIYEVEALDTYEKNNISDCQLGRIPKAGERFKVNKERLDVLLGGNERDLVFIKVIKEIKKEGDKKNEKENRR